MYNYPNYLYPNYGFDPSLTRAINPSLYSVPVRSQGLGGLLSSLKGGLGATAPISSGVAKTGFTFSGFLNGASRTLNVINQAIPIINQAKPLWTNAKTMIRVARSVRDVDNTNTNTNTSNNNVNTTIQTQENGPNFFI